MTALRVPTVLTDNGGMPGMLAVGPFVMIHNGSNTVGAFLSDVGDGTYFVSDFSRTYEIGPTYEFETDDDMLHMTSVVYESEFTLRPLTLDDQAWIDTVSGYDDLDLMKAVLLEQLRGSTL